MPIVLERLSTSSHSNHKNAKGESNDDNVHSYTPWSGACLGGGWNAATSYRRRE